jgi:hypothetical protein
MLRRIISVVRGVLVAIDDALGTIFKDTIRERIRRGEVDPQEEMRRNLDKAQQPPPPPPSPF